MIFVEKYFLCYTPLTDQISLPFLYEVLGIVGTVFCLPVCEVINFTVNLGFLIKLFSCMTKTSGQKIKYLENKKSF